MPRRRSLHPTSQMSNKDVVIDKDMDAAFVRDLKRQHKSPPADVKLRETYWRPTLDAPEQTSGASSSANW